MIYEISTSSRYITSKVGHHFSIISHSSDLTRWIFNWYELQRYRTFSRQQICISRNTCHQLTCLIVNNSHMFIFGYIDPNHMLLNNVKQDSGHPHNRHVWKIPPKIVLTIVTESFYECGKLYLCWHSGFRYRFMLNFNHTSECIDTYNVHVLGHIHIKSILVKWFTDDK